MRRFAALVAFLTLFVLPTAAHALPELSAQGVFGRVPIDGLLTDIHPPAGPGWHYHDTHVVEVPPGGRDAIDRTYDAGGRLISEEMGPAVNGGDGGVNPVSRHRTLTYAGGRVSTDTTTEVDATLTLTYGYDERGRLSKETEAWTGSGEPSAVGNYTYTRTTTWTDGPNGSSFDTLVEWQTAALPGQLPGGVTSGSYHEKGITDAAGQVIQRWSEGGPGGGQLARMRAVHDALGRPLVSQEDGLAPTTYKYASGALVARTVVAPVPETTTYAYDPAGRLAHEAFLPLQRHIRYQYGPLGQVSEQSVQAGNETTTLLFDAAGNLRSKALPGDQTWTYSHSATGLLLKTVPPGADPNIEAQAFRYDYSVDGLLTDIHPPAGPGRHYDYDSRGRPFHVDVVAEGGAGRERTTFDWQGNVETRTGPVGWTDVTHTDGRGRAWRVEHQRQAGAAVLETFDAATSRESRFGPTDQPVSILETLSAFAGDTVSPAGTRQYTYTYDAAGRISTANEPEGTVSYTYVDAPVRQVVASLPDNASETRTFDSLGRLTQIQRTGQNELTLGWNPGGTLASITGRGLTESRSYDPNARHRLAGINITDANAQALVSLAYAYDFDAVGEADSAWLTVRRSDLGAPALENHYFADAQMRLTKSVEGDITRTFTWHPDGRRDTEEVVDASGPNLITRHVRHRYDTFGQLAGISKWVEGENEPELPSITVQTDALGQVTGYSDPVNGTQRQLIWDAEGHLVAQSVTADAQPAVDIGYRYNWRDQRIARTLAAPAVPTTYLWGPDGLLRESGASTTDYVHGAGMILAAGEVRLAHDHLGSPIVSLIAGGVGSAGTFDGWGRYFSGPAPNDDNGEPPTTHVGYTGHAYDADSDLTYAEARWYDPDIGAFRVARFRRRPRSGPRVGLVSIREPGGTLHSDPPHPTHAPTTGSNRSTRYQSPRGAWTASPSACSTLSPWAARPRLRPARAAATGTVAPRGPSMAARRRSRTSGASS